MAALLRRLLAIWTWIWLHILSFFRRYRRKGPVPVSISVTVK